MTTPRNSVIFPAEDAERTPGRGVASKSGRTLSELLKLHAMEKGGEGRFSQEEVSRVAEVLGQWVSSRASSGIFFVNTDMLRNVITISIRLN